MKSLFILLMILSSFSSYSSVQSREEEYALIHNETFDIAFEQYLNHFFSTYGDITRNGCGYFLNIKIENLPKYYSINARNAQMEGRFEACNAALSAYVADVTDE